MTIGDYNLALEELYDILDNQEKNNFVLLEKEKDEKEISYLQGFINALQYAKRQIEYSMLDDGEDE